eukprot:COSAG06_NODE_51763_length_310_cov_0.691943_1_plen_52_part_01
MKAKEWFAHLLLRTPTISSPVVTLLELAAPSGFRSLPLSTWTPLVKATPPAF